MGTGYLMVLVFLFTSHQGHDGKPGLSIEDIVDTYYGNRSGRRPGQFPGGRWFGDLSGRDAGADPPGPPGSQDAPAKGHRDHVLVALFDNATGQRIEDAKVTGRMPLLHTSRIGISTTELRQVLAGWLLHQAHSSSTKWRITASNISLRVTIPVNSPSITIGIAPTCFSTNRRAI